MKTSDVKIWRALDANFNRVKEGLRVCEDVCRFVYDDRSKAKAFKDMRHEISQLIGPVERGAAVAARDIEGDVGKASIGPEMNRKTVEDILFANLQRVKESIRVLEEFSKLASRKNAQEFKILRYRLYDVERALARKR